MTEMEKIVYRKYLNRMSKIRKRRQQIKRRRRATFTGMICFVLFITTVIISGISSEEVTTATASNVEVQIVYGSNIYEAEKNAEETSETTTADETQQISGTQVLEGEKVEEVTEDNEVKETTEATKEVETSAWMEYTHSDVELLANIMYAEEGVLYTQYYSTNPTDVETVCKLCGSVVLHRLANEMGGAKTIYEVLYSCPNGQEQYADSTKSRIENGLDVPEIFYVWAESLLHDGPIGPNNLVFQAEFVQGTVYAQYWNQIFCVSPYYPE